jgi:hypothetical protein
MEKIEIILNFISENEYLIALFGLLLIEIILRITPTVKDISIVNKLHSLFEFIISNRAAEDKVISKPDGTKKKLKKYFVKKIKEEYF